MFIGIDCESLIVIIDILWHAKSCFKRLNLPTLVESAFIFHNIHNIIRSGGKESLIWVGYYSLGQLLAPKKIEIERSQIEDNVMTHEL